MRTAVVAVWVLLVGGTLAVDPAGQWPFGPLRATLVACAVVVLWAAVPAGQRLPRLLHVAWAVLLGALAAAALTNGDVWTAVVGTGTRHFGWLTWLGCAGMFSAGTRLHAHLGEIQRAGAAACAVIGTWCMWELAFGPPVATAATTDRLLGPFGSAAATAAGLCLLLPLALGLATDRTQRRSWRWLGGAALSTGALAAAGTGTRGAWLALAVAAVVSAWQHRPTGHGRVLAAAAVLALAAAAPWMASLATRPEGPWTRVDEWRIGAHTLLAHPLGAGPEGYRLVVQDGMDAAYERAHPRDTVLPDRAHSGPLDVGLQGGWLALAAYLALTAAIGRAALGALRRERAPSEEPAKRTIAGSGAATPATRSAAAAVLAYGVGQWFLFPLAELDPAWWLVAGALVGRAAGVGPTRQPPSGLHHWRAGVAFVAVAIITVGGVLDISANRLARRAVQTGDPAAALRAVELRPDDVRYETAAVALLLERGRLSDMTTALATARRALSWSPHDPIALQLEAEALLAIASATGKSADIEAALDAWAALAQRDPLRRRWLLQFGRASALAGDSAAARAAFAAAADLGDEDAAALLSELTP